MRPFHSLFTKVFLWFWATLTAGSIVVLLVTLITGSQPFGARWMRLTQDLYAHSALDFYRTGGDAGLQRYLSTLRDSSSMHAALLDASGHDILTHQDRSRLRIVARAIATGKSSLEPGRIWRAASIVDDNGTRYIFLNEVYPLARFVDGTFIRPVFWRFLLAMAIAGLFSFLLARSLVRPIQALQHGALAVAAGNLRTRVTPNIKTGHVELADTARAFDLMAERLEEMVRRREQLLADMSHELRSPLTRLSVSLELIRRGELDVIDRMDADLERMNAMIAQILLLARLENGTGQWNARPVELEPLLESIVADANHEGQPAGKTVSLDAGAACTVMGDADLLRSCIENIVRNALRYSPDKGNVDVKVKRASGAAVQIDIEDEGPGVPEETLPYLFDPFYRVSSSRTPGPGSNVGLGMSIAERAARVHGGSITATNRDGSAGLRVTIVLPPGTN